MLTLFPSGQVVRFRYVRNLVLTQMPWSSWPFPLWLTRCLQCSVPHDFVESLGECLFERQRTGAHAGLETPEKRTAGCAKAGWPETQENTIRRLGLGYSASPTVLLPAPRMSHGIADNSAHFASCTLRHLETGSGLGTVEELVWKSHCHKCFPVAAPHLDEEGGIGQICALKNVQSYGRYLLFAFLT